MSFLFFLLDSPACAKPVKLLNLLKKIIRIHWTALFWHVDERTASPMVFFFAFNQLKKLYIKQ